MYKTTVPNALSVRPCVDALRFHCRVSAVWIAALLIVIIILTVAAVLPGVLKANHQSHETRISDLELVTQR